MGSGILRRRGVLGGCEVMMACGVLDREMLGLGMLALEMLARGILDRGVLTRGEPVWTGSINT